MPPDPQEDQTNFLATTHKNLARALLYSVVFVLEETYLSKCNFYWCLFNTDVALHLKNWKHFTT